MIHWISVSVPVYIPGSEFVLFWLLGGLATFIFMVVKDKGVRNKIRLDEPHVSLLRTSLIYLTWPVIAYVFCRYRRR